MTGADRQIPDLRPRTARGSDGTPMVLPSLTNFIFALYTLFFPPDVSQNPKFPRNALNFRLRQFHAVTPSAHVYFADAPLHSSLHPHSQPLSIPIAPVRTARPPSSAAFSQARTLSMRGQSTTLDWGEDEIIGPDVSKRETLLLLAKMTSNAYFGPDKVGWYNLSDEWDVVRPLYVLSEWRFCILTLRSTLRLGGSQMMTDSEGTYSQRTITALSSFPSKARPHSGSTTGRPPKKTS